MEYTFGATEDIFLLSHIICCDDIPEEVDAAVIFGETKANTFALLDALRLAHMRFGAKKIAVSAGYALGESIVADFEDIRNDLFGLLGISNFNDIFIQFPLSKKLPPCTDAEAIGLVDFTREQGWKSVYLIAPPLHQFRAFYSLASAILKAGSDLVVWNWVSGTRGWNERIKHSQTAPEDIRWNLLSGELEKIETYFRKGDHVSAKEVLEYIARRYQ